MHAGILEVYVLFSMFDHLLCLYLLKVIFVEIAITNKMCFLIQ